MPNNTAVCAMANAGMSAAVARRGPSDEKSRASAFIIRGEPIHAPNITPSPPNSRITASDTPSGTTIGASGPTANPT